MAKQEEVKEDCPVMAAAYGQPYLANSDDTRKGGGMKDTVLKKCFTVFRVLFLISLILVTSFTYDIVAGQQKEPCLEPRISTIVPNAAKPGDQVRIRGRRFGREQGEVVFNQGIKAEIVTWKNSGIWVIVPQSAKSGPVTVSVTCGAKSNEKHFTVKR